MGQPVIEATLGRRAFVARMGGALAGAGLAACGLGRAGVAPPLASGGSMDAAGFHRARRYATLGAGRIAYLDRGVGRAALFLHGFPLNSYQWRSVVDRLQTVRRCITPDLMGLGYSAVPAEQSLTLEAQAEMIAKLLDRLGIRSVDLVGNDSGGATAQLFATRYPRRVRTLLLTNCDTQDDSPPASFLPVIAVAHAGKLAASLERQRDDIKLARSAHGLAGLAFSDPAGVTQETLDIYLGPLVSSPLRRAQVEAFTIGLERNPLAGIEPALRTLQAPSRIVWGAADTIFSPAGAQWLNRTLPMSRGVRMVPGAKLFFPEELPALVADEARQLWASA